MSLASACNAAGVSDVAGASATVEIRRMSNADYHAGTDSISASMLNIFAESPAKYDRLFVSRFETPCPQTYEMWFGSLAHLRLFEPTLFRKSVREIPTWAAKNGVKSGKLYESFAAELDSQGKHLVARDELRLLDRIAIEAQKVASDILGVPGYAELSFFWTCPRTGLRFRIRPDYLIVFTDGSTVIDLKTTKYASPSGFSRSFNKYGYGRQEAMYGEGLRLKFGHIPTWEWLAVQKVGEIHAKRYSTPPAEQARQRDQWFRLCDELAECYRIDTWPEKRIAA